MKEIEDIYKEVSNGISFDTFKELLAEATKEPHSFLLIDKYAQDERKIFGINFNQKFIVDPNEERRKVLKLDNQVRKPNEDKSYASKKRKEMG